MRVAIGLMLGAWLLAAGAASAEMTPADEAGVAAFTTCLDESGGDEEKCLDKLGRYAWYPRDNDVCEAVSTRVHRAISGASQAEWIDLFYNERCARLELTHDREAAKAGDKFNPKHPFAQCVRKTHNPFPCWEKFGRHNSHPGNRENSCEKLRIMSSTIRDLQWTPDWNETFENERCHRLGMSYFDPESEQP